MNIFITFDYELYFGERSGTARRCILQPADQLRDIAKRTGARFVFFVDAGYLVKLDEFAATDERCREERDKVFAQVTALDAEGHDVQLHIHPHWEDTKYQDGTWVMDTRRYKLSDFSAEEAARIIRQYRDKLQSLVSNPLFAYRAGGWCIQPFGHISAALKSAGIRLDSTVFPGGSSTQGNYSYDFRSAPADTIYHFEHDPVEAVAHGHFTEVPITAIRNHPLFFWRLFLLGRLNPSLHRPLGDGIAMAAPGYRKKLLTRITMNPLSVDGYNARLLDRRLRELERKNCRHMVVIGHPKAMSPYSMQQLEKFISGHQASHEFSTFSSVFR